MPLRFVLVEAETLPAMWSIYVNKYFNSKIAQFPVLVPHTEIDGELPMMRNDDGKFMDAI